MAFEIEEFTSVRLNNVNPRMEKHGPESVPAVDMNFIMDAPNDILSVFDGALLSALYTARTEAQPEQEEIDGLDPVSHLPNLRFPKMSPIKWDWRGAGYSIEIDYGIGGGKGVMLEGCEVGKFVIDPKEGGTVEIKFQVQAVTGLTEAIMGKLSLMIGSEVDITLLAPKTMDAQSAAVFDDPLFPGYVADAPLTAEDVFIGTADQAAAVH
ncbi:MAG: hypothetical protein KBG00_10705 [Rhodoferax sp.]|jgi:hypothetical protein|uniref:hypothetical protein n=1 Tax=Rhodoferax sp. TaxID=50421 RepID=UPI001B60A1B7|nr:hypothetical protein [Rhodoferax sp.]MBP9149239.1 hypothetical protein [Rhodoferax sp.]MBP9736190.1 hypothetical protein [Rhodoferax sp.]